MSSNLHDADHAEAMNSTGHTWLTIKAKNGDHVTIFMPLAKAQAMADAFNAPTTRPITLPHFDEAAQ